MKKSYSNQRHRLRELAFQLLFALDLRAGSPEKILEALWEWRDILAEVPADAFQEILIEVPSDGAEPDLTSLLAAQKGEDHQDAVMDPEEAQVLSEAKSWCLDIWQVREELDEILQKHVVNWRPERMATVDRAILRLALWEGALKQSVPVAVAIDEAVELAKKFGSDESGRFVNGVLAKIVREQQ